MRKIKTNSRTNDSLFFNMYMIESRALYRKYQVSSAYFSGILIAFAITCG